MATVSYDLQITVASGLSSSRDLTAGERSRIFGRPEVDSSKPKRPIIVSRQAAPQEGDENEETIVERLSELLEGGEAVQGEVDRQMDRLEEESARLVYKFDPQRKPDLAEAVERVFKGAKGEITFKMYRTALELDAELALELGRKLSDGIL